MTLPHIEPWPVLMSPWQMTDLLTNVMTGFSPGFGFATAPKPTLPKQQFLARRFSNEHGSRNYKLFIPSDYANGSMPMLVMLHGCSQSADDFAVSTRMNLLAEQKRCLVVYPEQSGTANCAKCWNWFEEKDQQRGQGEPAIIAGIAREVMAEFDVDTSRVFVAGLSAGGAMAVIMGRTYPDLFKAVGSHSGLPYGAANNASKAASVMRNGAGTVPAHTPAPGKTLPIIVFHGDRDTVVHPSHGAVTVAQSLMTPEGEAGTDGCPARAAIFRGEKTGRAYTHKVHWANAGEMVAEEWILHGAGHAWSGGNGRDSFSDARGPDAGTEMMRFFLDGPMREEAPAEVVAA
jgi:poly(hydroxyalkanoate) depolymerase family esterase